MNAINPFVDIDVLRSRVALCFSIYHYSTPIDNYHRLSPLSSSLKNQFPSLRIPWIFFQSYPRKTKSWKKIRRNYSHLPSRITKQRVAANNHPPGARLVDLCMARRFHGVPRVIYVPRISWNTTTHHHHWIGSFRFAWKILWFRFSLLGNCYDAMIESFELLRFEYD